MTEFCIKAVDDSKAKIIDCKTGKEIDICSLCGTGKFKRTRGKRAPSTYNIFMGQCVKGKSGPIKERFRSCVTDWKRK